MKIKTTAFIHVFYLILVSAVFVACSSGNKPEEKINKHDERINGAAITSEYEIRSDEECFELLSKSNHSFSYIPSSDNTEEPYCVVIPSEINGEKAEEILNFSDPGVVELYVPDGIRFISIYDCPKLEKLVFSDTVETISIRNVGENAIKLLDITWPDNDNLTMEEFEEVHNIKELYFPDNVNKICTLYFGGCEKLEKVEFPQSLNEIGDNCVYMMDSLERIEVPMSVSSIGFWSFSSCKKLSEIILHEGLLEIGEYSFSKLPSCKFIDVPDSVEKIGKGAFMNIISGEGENVVFDNTVITLGVGKGTYAEQYAIENGIKYEYH